MLSNLVPRGLLGFPCPALARTYPGVLYQLGWNSRNGLDLLVPLIALLGNMPSAILLEAVLSTEPLSCKLSASACLSTAQERLARSGPQMGARAVKVLEQPGSQCSGAQEWTVPTLGRGSKVELASSSRSPRDRSDLKSSEPGSI